MKHFRRVAGLAVVAGAIAVPGAAQAQVEANVDTGVAQVSTDSGNTRTGSGATAVDAAGVAINLEHHNTSVAVGDVAGVGMNGALVVSALGVDVALDDHLLDARTGNARAGARTNDGVDVTLRGVDTRSTTRRVLSRTCRSLIRRETRGVRLNGRQVRVLSACRRGTR